MLDREYGITCEITNWGIFFKFLTGSSDVKTDSLTGTFFRIVSSQLRYQSWNETNQPGSFAEDPMICNFVILKVFMVQQCNFLMTFFDRQVDLTTELCWCFSHFFFCFQFENCTFLCVKICNICNTGISYHPFSFEIIK